MKKFLSVLAISALIISSNTIYAEEAGDASTNNISLASLEEGFDTLSLTQSEYEGALSIQGMTLNNEDDFIERTCEIYIATSRAYVRMPASYSNVTFVSTKSIDTPQIAYRMSEFDYLTTLYDEFGWTITKDNISFDGFNVEINGDSATASIVESYSYYITNGFDTENFRRREYNFIFRKSEKGWEIVSVKTNDPWEDDTFDYVKIDVNNAVNAAKQISPVNEKAFEDGSSLFAVTSLNRWSYNVTKANNYAVAHYRDTSNSVFGFNSGANCQNFVSQCIWAGLGGSGTNPKAFPAVSTSVVGSNAPNVWCHNQYTNYYSDYNYNWAWDNVRGFVNMISGSSSSRQGPCGMYSSTISNADAGNALYLYNSTNTQTNANLSNINHAMFITQVTGNSGSRTKNNIKIAAHTNPTNSAYMSLAEYAPAIPANNFCRLTIYCGYYSSAQ